MSFPSHIWSQLKGISAKELIGALERDGWDRDCTVGAEQIFRKGHGRRVSIHVHPGKTFGPNLLKSILVDIGWTEKEMRDLKLIK